MVFLGTTSTPQTDDSKVELDHDIIISVPLKASIEGLQAETTLPFIMEEEPTDLDIASIAYAEEEEIELGFDTAAYLPENFDPAREYVNLNTIAYLEDTEEESVGINTEAYLPASFDPYAAPANFMDISYMEEEEIRLGFDTNALLPEGFDAYERELDLDTIVYIEDEDVDLGFDPRAYLPVSF